MESHELTSAVYEIKDTLKEILNVLQTSLNVLREVQEFKQVDTVTDIVAEVTKPKKQSKQTDKENN